MAKAFIDDTHLTDIADAIRATLDESRQYLPSEMAAAIDSIPVMAQLNRKKYFRLVPAGAASGYATIEKVEGNTLVWNQQVNDTSLSFYRNYGLTMSLNSHVLTVNGLSSGGNSVIGYYDAKVNLITNHKYLIRGFNGQVGSSSTFEYMLVGNIGSAPILNLYLDRVFTYGNVTQNNIKGQIVIRNGYTADNLQLSPQIFDLTQMFGAGNEPSTVADFEAWLAQNIGTLPYYDYNAGELLSVKMQSVKSVGFNQWDEEWEQGGISNGLPSSNSFQIRSKNFLPIFSNQDYCYRGYNYMWVYYYDADKNWIGSGTDFKSNDVLYMIKTSPQNARFVKFKYGYSDSPVTTYNHDICINISDTNKNGTYQPYMTDSADIDVTTITGINTATNVREVIFPTGMKQADYAGTVKDTLDLLSDTATVKCGIVDLGDGNWNYDSTYQLFSCRNLIYSKTKNTDKLLCIKYLPYTSSSLTMPDKTIGVFNANDALYVKDTAYTDPTIFKNAMNGVKLIYELATPITYTDLQDANGNPLNPRYKVEQGGTEQVLPANTSTPTTVAPTLTTTYTKDVH